MSIHQTDIELMKMQVEVLFIQDKNGHLQHINEPIGPVKPAPRFFFGYTNKGSLCKFRQDLPDSVIEQLKEVASAEPLPMNSQKVPKNYRQFEDILQSHAPIEHVWIGTRLSLS